MQHIFLWSAVKTVEAREKALGTRLAPRVTVFDILLQPLQNIRMKRIEIWSWMKFQSFIIINWPRVFLIATTVFWGTTLKLTPHLNYARRIKTIKNEWLLNCKGPQTISAANVGSTRDQACAFLKRPENFSGPETVPQSSRNDFRVFLKAPKKFWAREIRHSSP